MVEDIHKYQCFGSVNWKREAKNNGFNFEELLYQDKKQIFKNLKSLNIPHIKIMILSKVQRDELNKILKGEKNQLYQIIDEFLIQGVKTYIRFQPITKAKKIGYHSKRIEDLIEFIKSNNINLNNYEIQMQQNGTQFYSGGIISKNNKIIADVVKGHSMFVHQGVCVTPLGAIIDPFTKVTKYKNEDSVSFDTLPAKKWLYIALKHIKAFSEHPLEGYFEFLVNEQGLFFKNYQKKGGWVNI